MNVEEKYILGIADATLNMWEEMNGTIEAEKEVSFYCETINIKESVVGCKLYINYKVNNSEEDDEVQTINIYTKDTIGAVISDISEVLESINSSYTFNNITKIEW